jgi:Homeodomain-like domain
MSDMTPYALDLRAKILRAYDEHRGSQWALAALFGVSRAFVEKLIQRRRGRAFAVRRPVLTFAQHGSGVSANLLDGFERFNLQKASAHV